MKNNQEFYIVATPIGNLEDITLRALRILKEVDIILCEDTRVTRKFLNHYDIKTKTESYHAHSSQNKEEKILEGIRSGLTYALVSDAGTPTISDPGVKLVAKIRALFPEVSIVPLPGPTALISGLSITGFEGNQFTFYGFLPQKKGRDKIFHEIAGSTRISVFYESPHRLIKTLSSLVDYLEDGRRICVARELTKLHEESPIGTARELLKYFSDKNYVKGECVVIVNK